MDKCTRVCNVLEYIEKAAVQYPYHIAFCDEHSSVTYMELLDRIKKMGYGIAERCFVTGKPIVVLMDKCVECLISFFAIITSGNFYVCVDADMAVGRIKKILDNVVPAAVICKREIVKKVEMGRFPVFIYEELFFTGVEAEKMEKRLGDIRDKMIDTDPVYVLYTSGSTGIPKGSVISHKSVIAYAEWVSRTFNINDTAVFGSQTPFYFSMSVLDIYVTIQAGASLQIIPKKLFTFPIKLLEYLNEKKINIIYWVPSALSIVADWKALDYVKVPGLHTVLFAGEVMPTKKLNVWKRHMPDIMYANLFGPTEITDIGLYYILDREFGDGEPIPIGRPCKNMDAFAINEEGKRIGKNEIGELYFRGSFVGCGYYNNKERTKEAFVQNPLNFLYPEIVYRTGDLVKINEYGEYVYMGRKDFQIKHMGYRIELGEIEYVAGAQEDVERAVCIYDSGEDRIILLCQGSDKGGLLEYLKENLPSYMMPGEIIWMRSMPLNANGKIDRKLLQENYFKEK